MLQIIRHQDAEINKNYNYRNYDLKNRNYNKNIFLYNIIYFLVFLIFYYMENYINDQELNSFSKKNKKTIHFKEFRK